MHEGNYLVILLCSHCFHHSPVFPGVKVLMLWCLDLTTLLSNEWISFCWALINHSYGVFSFPPFWWLSKLWDFFYWLLNLYLIWEVRADIWYMNIKALLYKNQAFQANGCYTLYALPMVTFLVIIKHSRIWLL